MLGAKPYHKPQVRADGSSGSKVSISLGKGVKAKGAPRPSLLRGSRLRELAATEKAEAYGSEAQRAARREAEAMPREPKAKQRRETREWSEAIKREGLRAAGQPRPPSGMRKRPGAALSGSSSKKAKTL